MPGCPGGYDQQIWSLAEYFQSLAEGYNEGTADLPILYLQLKYRVDKSKIQEHNEWVRICRQMMDKFWDDCADPAKAGYAMSQFVNLGMFNDLLEYVLINRDTAWLLKHGRRVKLPGFIDVVPVPQPKRGHVRRCFR